MKKIWGMSAVLLACGVGGAQFACSSGVDEGTGVVSGDRKMDDLIGSVPVNSASLDGIGSIGLVYDYHSPGGSAGFGGAFVGEERGGGPNVGAAAAAGSFPTAGAGSTGSSFYVQCTGTLISKSSVLTSRSCAQLFEQSYYGYSSLKFAIGADPAHSSRRIDVVDVEYAPIVSTDAGTVYPDIAVLHLGELVTDVTPFPVAQLTGDLVGKPFAAVGYGNSDSRYLSGTRRAGSLTLRGTSGLLYPLIFGSFEAFYSYVLSFGYYPGPYYLNAQPGAVLGSGGTVGSAGFPSKGVGGEFGIAGAAGAFPNGGSGGAFPSGGSGGGTNDWYLQYLQQQYDTAQLAPGEAYLGGTDSDAQPCGADQGGPMVRKAQGQVRVFGVFSRTPLGGCSKGGVYAGITADTKAFVDAAAQWKDPCTGFSNTGKCVGTNATRCSTIAEGKRRLVKFDCSLLNQVCVASGDAEVACTDK